MKGFYRWHLNNIWLSLHSIYKICIEIKISDEFFLSVHHMRLVVALATRKLAHWFIISLYGVLVLERRCFVLPRCTWFPGGAHKVLMCGQCMSPECYIQYCMYIHWTLWYAYCYSSSLGSDSSVLFCVGQCSHLIVFFWLLWCSYFILPQSWSIQYVALPWFSRCSNGAYYLGWCLGTLRQFS